MAFEVDENSTFAPIPDKQIITEAACTLRMLMMNSESERVRFSAAKELLSYLKPKLTSVKFENALPVHITVVSAIEKARVVKALNPQGPVVMSMTTEQIQFAPTPFDP